jgi:hypothetical protein
MSQASEQQGRLSVRLYRPVPSNGASLTNLTTIKDTPFRQTTPEKANISLLRARIEDPVHFFPRHFLRNKRHWDRDDSALSCL